MLQIRRLSSRLCENKNWAKTIVDGFSNDSTDIGMFEWIRSGLAISLTETNRVLKAVIADRLDEIDDALGASNRLTIHPCGEVFGILDCCRQPDELVRFALTEKCTESFDRRASPLFAE